jgi:iron complex outermembrane receptor protein
MTRKTLLRDAINTALYGGAALALVAAPNAFAQDDAGTELETITVVGSRIKRTDIETSQPVFVIEREDLQKTGLSSVGDILQDLTTSGAALNTTFNNGGNGETNVNLRNLGANRTLVLVNGRRWVSNLFGIVDLNTIPVSVIERVEVLKDGASAIYGSDAIAGVINITTRDSYDGAEASAYLGENEEGDGRTELYDFTIGSSTDRASVIMNAAYAKQEPIFAGDREISANPLFGFGGNNVFAGASSSTPFGRFGFGNGAVLPNGAPGTLTLIPGRPGTSAGDFRPINLATDGFNFAPDNYLLTPQERTSIFVQARYDITDNISFNTTLLYNERRSEQQLAASPFTFGTVGAGLGTFTIPASALYNPFGVDVTRAQYRNTEQTRNFSQDVDTFYFGGTLEGSFDMLERNFSWDVNYIYTDNERRDTTEGLFNLAALAQGLGPSFLDANGVPTCGTPTAPIAGCVPVNIFGGPEGFTREMADFTSFTGTDTRYKKLYDYTANITGDLFELPAGPLGFAAGYEYRREFGFDNPDALVSSGASTGNIRQPTEGGFSLDEFYAEFNIPILKDLAFAETSRSRSRRATRTTPISARRPTRSSASAGSRSPTSSCAATTRKASARRACPSCSSARPTRSRRSPTRVPRRRTRRASSRSAASAASAGSPRCRRATSRRTRRSASRAAATRTFRRRLRARRHSASSTRRAGPRAWTCTSTGTTSRSPTSSVPRRASSSSTTAMSSATSPPAR